MMLVLWQVSPEARALAPGSCCSLCTSAFSVLCAQLPESPPPSFKNLCPFRRSKRPQSRPGAARCAQLLLKPCPVPHIYVCSAAASVRDGGRAARRQGQGRPRTGEEGVSGVLNCSQPPNGPDALASPPFLAPCLAGGCSNRPAIRLSREGEVCTVLMFISAHLLMCTRLYPRVHQHPNAHQRILILMLMFISVSTSHSDVHVHFVLCRRSCGSWRRWRAGRATKRPTRTTSRTSLVRLSDWVWEAGEGGKRIVHLLG